MLIYKMKTKNKTKIMILLAVIIFSLMIIGCQPIDDYTDFSMKDIRKGNQGLEIKFLKNTPPDVLYENDPNVFISLSVANRGATHIKEGAIAIAREEDYLSFDRFFSNGRQIEEPILFDLRGKTFQNRYGDEIALEVEGHTKDLTLSKFQDSLLTVTGCYDYQTILSESVCIEPDQYKNQMISKACRSEDLAPSTQGAPVNVKSVGIQSKRVNNDITRNIFRIKVGNDRQGKVITKGIAEEMCSSGTVRDIEGIDYRKVLDFVNVTAHLSGKDMKCNNDGMVFLENGKSGETLCKIDTRQPGTYVAPLVIELNYGYTFTVSKSFKIEKI